MCAIRRTHTSDSRSEGCLVLKTGLLITGWRVLNSRNYNVFINEVTAQFTAQYAKRQLGLISLYIKWLFPVVMYVAIFAAIKGGGVRGGMPFLEFALTGFCVWVFFDGGTDAGKLVVKNVSEVGFFRSGALVVWVVSVINGLCLTVPMIAILCFKSDNVDFVPIWLLMALFVHSLGLALGGIFQILSVFFSDIMDFLSYFKTIFFFTSAIVIDLVRLPEEIQWYLDFNPVFFAVEIVRGFYMGTDFDLSIPAFMTSGVLIAVFVRLIKKFCELLN